MLERIKPFGLLTVKSSRSAAPRELSAILCLRTIHDACVLPSFFRPCRPSNEIDRTRDDRPYIHYSWPWYQIGHTEKPISAVFLNLIFHLLSLMLFWVHFMIFSSLSSTTCLCTSKLIFIHSKDKPNATIQEKSSVFAHLTVQHVDFICLI